MKKFEIQLCEQIMHTVTVEAEDRDTAVDTAWNVVGGVEGSPDLDYDTESTGMVTWTVTEL